MNRDKALAKLKSRSEPWDVLIIGGGATGAAIALDAATRGYSTLLLERGDFGCGTSSRSTKLIHGGVRYLAQFRFKLIFEALRERACLRTMAPHLVHERRFIIPASGFIQALWYWLGLKLYDFFSMGDDFRNSRWCSLSRLKNLLPGLDSTKLRYGIEYSDGQFDDARLLLDMLKAAIEHAACALNYCEVTGFLYDPDGRVSGVQCVDLESDNEYPVNARVVINAAGPFSAQVASFDESAQITMAPSRGSHVVLSREFLSGDRAVLMPATADGRIMFAIPWQGYVLIGTTDEAVFSPSVCPHASEDEIDFMLATASQYLQRKPTREDVLASFAGIRPLVCASQGAGSTAELSREHEIFVSDNKLVSITGGKWTTARLMASECLDQAEQVAQFSSRECVTESIRLADPSKNTQFSHYGRDADAIQAMCERDESLLERLHPEVALTRVECLWAVRHEMARTLEDVLARRSRLLMLNHADCLLVAPALAQLIAQELDKDQDWQSAQLELLAAALGTRTSDH